MVKMIALKCPSCNSDLTVEPDREQLFCQYCGTKILLKNENEYVVRQINEAEIIHAETDRIVQLKRLDAEVIDQDEEKKNNRSKKIVSLVLGTISLSMFFIGIMVSVIAGEGNLIGVVWGLILIGLYLGLFSLIMIGIAFGFLGKKEEKERKKK